MEMGNQIVPVGQFNPYTNEDLTVIVPHVSWHPNRAKWFFPQYLRSIPSEVKKNTIVVYDGDNATALQLQEYGLRGEIVSTSDWSTYKMARGFELVETRLCVRIHNDTYFARDDWVQSLVKQFNNDPSPQLIGWFHPSGNTNKEMIDNTLKYVPSFKSIYNNLEFDGDRIGASFLGAFFTATQSYIYKTVYPLVVKINEWKMDKEDCLLTLVSSLYNVKIISWDNISEFATVAGKPGDFDEEVMKILPYDMVKIDDSNRGIYPEAQFSEKIVG
jgi:hypothetical protein